VDADGLRARVASVSFIAEMAPPEREDLLGRVDALARDAGLADTIEIPYRTDLFWCRSVGG